VKERKKKMRKTKLTKILSLVLSTLMVFSSCAVMAYAAPTSGDTSTTTGSGFVVPDNMYLVSDTQQNIVPGVTENRLVTNATSGDAQVVGYAVSVDLSNPNTSIAAGYADYNGSQWKMQTVRDQAKAYENAHAKDEGNKKTVVAAFNADIFNMSTGKPTGGPLVMNGTCYVANLGKSYFGITKDGKAVIGDNLTQETLDTLREAVGGFYVIVKNGKPYGHGTVRSSLVPKTAVGIKADGSVVFYVADGRNYPISCGLDDYDLARIMIGLGCVDVLNLDGGGSATYLAKYEGDNYLSCANNPSDGNERTVSSSLFVVSTAKASGEFDHASLLPNNELYTPGYSVDFSAVGVDSAGMPADLPEDGKFVLDDASAALGTITDDGKFTSNGTKGVVTVNYMSDGKVAGSTSIEIVDPDEIYFSDSEISLGFEEENDLGLVVKYKDRDVNYKDGDFVWSTTYDALSNEQKLEFNGKNVIFKDNVLYYYEKTEAGKASYVIKDALTEEECTEFYNTILGTFRGNTFISSSGNSVTGTVTVKYGADETVTASIKAIVGKLPVVVDDFENLEANIGRAGINASGGTVQVWDTNPNATYDLITGHYVNGDNSDRGGVESAKIVDVASGEPVRFGNASLKLDYDFTKSTSTEGACVGYQQQGIPIDGNPTGIGMWVYAPEGTPNLWLRIRVLDGNNTVITLDFTTEKQGISWNGWKYVECDLTKNQGPFKLLAGETIRIMYLQKDPKAQSCTGVGYYLAGTVGPDGPDGNSVYIGKAASKGSLYIDNLQFVYGANTDDIDNPIVNSITANNTEIENGTVINTDTINFQTTFSDVQNKYTTGVNYKAVKMYVDGKDITADGIVTEGDERFNVYDVRLADGEHTVTAFVRDNFGNETTDTRTFTVDTKGESELTAVKVSASESAVIGKNVTLSLNSDNLADVKSVNAIITLSNDFNNYTVKYNDAFKGAEPVFNAKTNELTISATLKEGAAAEGSIADIDVAVPASTPSGTQFTYSASGSFETVSEVEGATNTFGCSTKRINVTAPLNIEFSAVVGLPGQGKVTDASGNAVRLASVYSADGTFVAFTSKNGTFTTSKFSDAVQSVSVYAKKGDALSFILNSQSVAPNGNEDGSPSNIIINASADGATQKNISWLSNPVESDDNAVVQYALKSEYEANGEAAFKEAKGDTEIRYFYGSGVLTNNYAVMVNSVVVTELTPDSEYVYRVGDGKVFSAVSSFKTRYKGTDTNFFVIGDTQADDTTSITNIINQIANSGTDFSFGVQTGDFVETATLYSDWEAILDVFSTDYMNTVDMIHVIGNHEQSGDNLEDLFAAALYNATSSTHYSAQYGNVYVAVINYVTDEEQLAEELEWLKKDAAESNAQWKILVSHQPAYSTNNTTDDTDAIYKLVPSVLDELGFDFMFSGHDHSLARTEPLTGGNVAEDGNGVVYYICGSTGEKSYPVTNTPEYHYVMATQDYTAVYLTVSANDSSITVDVHESDGRVIDTYTKNADTACVTDGHKYVYADDYFTCSVCGHSEKLSESITGFVTDKATGKTMHFVNGVKNTGWHINGDDIYYFDENGLAVTGDVTITTAVLNQHGQTLFNEDVTYHFGEDGKQDSGTFKKCSDGVTRCFRGGNLLRGWHEINGSWYYFASDTDAMQTNYLKFGQMYVGVETTHTWGTDASGKRRTFTYEFDDEGRLLKGTFATEDDGNIKYYWAGKATYGWLKLDGYTYYFDLTSGNMVKGNVTIDGKNYFFDDEGHLATGRVENGNEVNYINADGEVVYTGANDVCLTLASEENSELAEYLKTANALIDENGNITETDFTGVTLKTGMIAATVVEGKITSTKAIVVMGDIDCDGDISVSDARDALRAAVKLDTLTALRFYATDIDHDGERISVMDAREVLRAAVRLTDGKEWLAK
jgi:trimeric autotransporter adhesin